MKEAGPLVDRVRDPSHESIPVRLPKEQVEALMQIAAAEFRSLPEQIAYIVTTFLIRRGER
jgi:hypothetical protein